ncbi:MAG TPA: hypothetical protein VFM12_01460 [Gemmatimonadales bacterium]|nr:hypothetical protein [Gemmatimonadales bacterium]
MHTIVFLIALAATWYFGLPWWAPAVPAVVFKAVMLVHETQRDYLAAMNYARLEGGGRVAPLPILERDNEPEVTTSIMFVAPEAMLNNFLTAHLVGIFLLATYPRWWKGEVGLTYVLKRIIREEPESWRGKKARAIAVGRLERYSPTGQHVL